ncbi:Macoilin [Trichinella pseudospiralis]|uniref:Macoilin n=1 Tax=Trichinella pseudospiralis TaxID=6337 RepID=A0A0V1IFC9_TRIPS|nr:Macoilin [Trichinella pseudospiralis]KRZ28306.1 Macoilin [Trichinella pseudospiralis]
MKRRTTDNAKLRRAFKKNKMPESLCGSSLIYFKMILVWTVVMMADFMLEFRFEYFWPFWLMLRCIYDSFRYQGMTFTVFFICVTFTSDMICFIFVPVQWVFFIASTYVWVQYVWHAADRGICLPTTTLWMIFLYVEASVRLKELKTLPLTLDLCRPLAAHCIGYPVVTLGFDVKSYVSYRLRLRRQKEISRTNQFYWSLLFFALPGDKVGVSSEKCKGSAQLKEESGGSVRNGNIIENGASPTTDGVNALQVALPKGTAQLIRGPVQSTGGAQSKSRNSKQSIQPSVIDCEPTLGNGGALFSGGGGGGGGVALVSSSTSRQRQNSTNQKQIRKRRAKLSKKSNQNDPVPYQEEPSQDVEPQLTSWWSAGLRQICGSLDWLMARFGHYYSGGVVACNDTDYADSETSSENKDEHRKLVDYISTSTLSAANKQANNSKLPTSSASCMVADRTGQNRKNRRKGGGACGASTGPTVELAAGSGMDMVTVRDAIGSSGGTLARITTVTDRDMSVCCCCEADLEKMKLDLRTSKSREQELRLQLMEMSNVECSLKSELNELKINNEQLQTRVQNLLRSRQQDRQVINGLEKKIAEEQKAKVHLDQQLQQERRATKKAEEATAALISSRQQAAASAGSFRNGDCEQCRRRRDGEKELKHARKELTQREEQIGKLESEVRTLRLFKESNTVEQLTATVTEMERKNAHLESSLSAETRIKLDLFSALGESKRQHEIVLGQLDEQRKVIVDLQRKLNEFSNGVRHHGSTTQSPQNTVSSSLSPPPHNAHCNLAVRAGTAFITSEGHKIEHGVLLSPSPPVYSPTYIANVSPFGMEEPRCSSYPAPNMQARILNNKIGNIGNYRFKTHSP